jgi:hypothetical protein
MFNLSEVAVFWGVTFSTNRFKPKDLKEIWAIPSFFVNRQHTAAPPIFRIINPRQMFFKMIKNDIFVFVEQQ